MSVYEEDILAQEHRELEQLARIIEKVRARPYETITADSFDRAMRLLSLRGHLKRFGYDEARVACVCDPYRVAQLGVPSVVHLREENGDVLQFNEDYSEVHVERNVGSTTTLSLEFCYQSRMRADGVRTALTDSALYIHIPREAP